MSFDELLKIKGPDTKILEGIPAAPGYAIGPVFIYQKETIEIYPSVSIATDYELEALDFAIERSKKELRKVVEFSREKINEKMAGIFEAHLMILEDQMLIDAIKKILLRIGIVRNILLMLSLRNI